MSKKKRPRSSGRKGEKRGKGLVQTWRRLSPAVRFVLSFVFSLLVLGTGYAVLTAKYSDSSWLLNSTAAVAGWIASFFSSQVVHTASNIRCSGFSVEIIDECTGLFEMVIYVAAVVAFSTSIKNKLIGVAMGLPTIYAFNVIRIVVLLFAGAHSQRLFRFMHLYFWQVTLVLIIGSVWVLWLYLVVFREKKRAVAVSR